MTDANVLLKWLRYERIDGVPDEERRRQCADIIERQAAELEQARNLLRGAQTHLLDGDNSIWRSQVDEFVRKADGLHFDAALRESRG